MMDDDTVILSFCEWIASQIWYSGWIPTSVASGDEEMQMIVPASGGPGDVVAAPIALDAVATVSYMLGIAKIDFHPFKILIWNAAYDAALWTIGSMASGEYEDEDASFKAVMDALADVREEVENALLSRLGLPTSP